MEMLDKRLWWTTAAISLTAVLSVCLMNLPGAEEPAPAPEPVAGIRQDIPQESQAEEEPAAPGYAYLVKEHNGRIAVFAAGSEEPQIVFEVLVKYLPDYDQIQMREGIQVKDFEALSVLIEDYIS